MKKQISIYLLAGLVFTLSSCYKKLQLEPANAITNEQLQALLQQGDESLWAGVVGSLPTLIITTDTGAGALDWRYNRYTGANIMRGLEANDMIFATQTLAGGAFGATEYQMTSYRTAGGQSTEFCWRLGWLFVTAANKILNTVTDEVVAANPALPKYQAWALFARAFSYNYLLDNFADSYALGGGQALGVPIYTRFEPRSDGYVARSTLAECYAQINADLDRAIADFLADGSDGFQTEATAIDIGAAYFLKARVALNMGNWNDVITNCQNILNKYGTPLMNESQYVAQRSDDGNGNAIYYAVNSGFLSLAQNPEVIYGFSNAAAGAANQTVSQWMNLYGCGNAAGSSAGLNIQIDEQLYNLIDDQDYRKKNFLEPGNPDIVANYPYQDGNSQSILPYASIKFAATVGFTGNYDLSQAASNSQQAEYPMWRISEVLLMKAEAEAQNGGDWESTLNILIGARTNGALTVATYPAHSGLTPLQIIQLQTRIEMWGENGLEFYNNRRWNIPVDRTASTNHWSPTRTYTVANMTSQIPTAQMNLNGLLVQNP